MANYYTPNIEDLFVGYKCEISKNDGPQAGIWGQNNNGYEVSESTYGDLMNTIISIRTKYLDKEDIESCGWVHTGGQLTSYGRQDFENAFHILNFYPARVDNIGLSMIQIKTKEDPFVMGSYKGYDKVLYDGSCKSINELRKIMQWLNIK